MFHVLLMQRKLHIFKQLHPSSDVYYKSWIVRKQHTKNLNEFLISFNIMFILDLSVKPTITFHDLEIKANY